MYPHTFILKCFDALYEDRFYSLRTLLGSTLNQGAEGERRGITDATPQAA